MPDLPLSAQASAPPANPIAYYSDQIAAHPEILSNYWHLGLAWLLLGDETTAQMVWFSAVAVAPETVAAGMAELLTILENAAREQLQLGKFAAAEQIYLQMLEIDAAPETGLNLGSVVAQQGRYEEAIAHWQHVIDLCALDLQPDLAEAHRRQAEVWQKLGQWSEAIAAYEQAIQLLPTAALYSEIGWCFGQLGDWQAAEAEFRQALRLEPENSDLPGDLGWALLQQQNGKAAIAHFQQVVRLQSRFVQAYCAWVDSLEQPSPTLAANARFLTALHCDLSPHNLPHENFYPALEHLLRVNPPVMAPVTPQNMTGDRAIAPFPPELPNCSVPSETVAAGFVSSPSGFYLTTRDWRADPPNGSASEYLPLDPPHPVLLTPPQTLEAEIHFSFRFGEAIVLPETFVAEIPQGRFWLSPDQTSSAVIAPNQRILGDLSAEFPLLSPNHPDCHPSQHSVLALPSLPPVQKINGTVAVLSGLANDLYFHWMLDVLPRWALLQRSGIDIDAIDGFVVSDRLPFQAETLAALGIPSAKILPQACHIQVDRLIVPSYPGSPAWMPQWVCQWLQQRFLSAHPSLSADAIDRSFPPAGARLYLSRSQASYRRLINESEVMQLLEPLGFQAVTLEALSVRAQAELLSQAAVVISPHGGGLTNLAFCRAGTQVIELFAPDYVYPCYWFLSNLAGLEYAYLIGKVPSRGLHQLLYADARREDIWIDLDELRSLLHRILSTAPHPSNLHQ